MSSSDPDWPAPPPSPADHPALEAALGHARRFLADLDHRLVGATADVETLRHRLARPLAEHGMAPEVVIDELARDADPELIGSAGGRFFGWVMGGGLPRLASTAVAHSCRSSRT